jgi:hypothetical protein
MDSDGISAAPLRRLAGTMYFYHKIYRQVNIFPRICTVFVRHWRGISALAACHWPVTAYFGISSLARHCGIAAAGGGIAERLVKCLFTFLRLCAILHPLNTACVVSGVSVPLPGWRRTTYVNGGNNAKRAKDRNY